MATANSHDNSHVTQKSILDDTKENGQKLRQSSIRLPQNYAEPNSSKAELQQLIQQLQAIQFINPPQKNTDLLTGLRAAGAVKSDADANSELKTGNSQTSQNSPPQVTEPCMADSQAAQIQTSGPTGEQKETKKTVSPAANSSDGPITSQTLAVLLAASENTDRLINPAAVAHTLFINGKTKEAARFYQVALNRIDIKDPNKDRFQSEERAWLLLQIGNCLRRKDPEEARKAYKQVVVEYPNSTWADLAVAQDQLIEWYKTNESLKLFEGANQK